MRRVTVLTIAIGIAWVTLPKCAMSQPQRIPNELKWPAPVAQPAKVRVILFCPSDVAPPKDFQTGIDRLCNYTDDFILKGIRSWGGQPAVESLFVRKDGHVEVLGVIGKKPKSGYSDPSVHKEAIASAAEHYGIELKQDIWWVLVYVGDPPVRFSGFRGGGSPQFGGWSVANYDSRVSRIRPGIQIAGELGDEMALKGMIHELGHAFGLPHIGPRFEQRPGNTLMGPTNFNYRRIQGKHESRAYVSEAAAAMLEAHPIVRGRTLPERKLHPTRLANLSAELTKDGSLAVSGQMKSDGTERFAILADHRNDLPGAYWVKHFVNRLDATGRFQFKIESPDPTGGELRLWFVFSDGAITGNGRARGVPNSVKRSYTLANGAVTLGAPAK